GPKFLKASVGFGGSCFQKDILNLVYIAKSYGLTEVADYWEQVIIMNDHQKRRFAANIVKTLYNTVSGKDIAMLGWAFKKDTNDTRESAAIYVCDELLNERANIRVYDPKVSKSKVFTDLEYLSTRSNQENEDLVTVVTDPYKACKNSHAIAVMTEWDEFKTYDWQKIYDNMQKPAFIFDGRNLLDVTKLEEIGFKVYSIGIGK
ncbi:UDP binding domain-containing protein, partial [Aquimarina agarivorans]|uniref:UDP binding domain-containing protein n=1 Tax=Aquimarina agarivorans TaxID=980584 RepID=UPI000248EB2A